MQPENSAGTLDWARKHKHETIGWMCANKQGLHGKIRQTKGIYCGTKIAHSLCTMMVVAVVTASQQQLDSIEKGSERTAGP